MMAAQASPMMQATSRPRYPIELRIEGWKQCSGMALRRVLMSGKSLLWRRFLDQHQNLALPSFDRIRPTYVVSTTSGLSHSVQVVVIVVMVKIF